MNNKSLFIVIALLFCLFITKAEAQSIKIVRPDVDSIHDKFVTASYLFGIDIVTDSVQRCNGVAFQLRYNLAKYIKYSGYSVFDSSRKTSSVVIPQIDSVTGDGVLSIGVLTGDSIGAKGIDNPRVIHLEFVVSQSVPEASELTFTFVNAQAVVTRNDTVGVIVPLSSKVTKYKIHTFVTVWPGDADNNGVVDTRDISKIGLFLEYGMPGNTMRSFRREPTSTIWYPQKVLTWDSTEVTYADCDGNGSVTITDMLVVPLNFNKVTSKVKHDNDIPQNVEVQDEPVYSAGAERIPIFIESSQPIIGAAAEISLSDILKDAKVLGIEKGNMFGNSSFFFSKVNENEGIAQIAAGITERNIIEPEKGVLAYIVTDKKVNKSPSFNELNGITDNGFIFPLSAITSVEDMPLSNIGLIRIDRKKLILNNVSNDRTPFTLYNINGMVINTGNTLSGETAIDISGLAKGIYFIKIGEKTIKFVVD